VSISFSPDLWLHFGPEKRRPLKSKLQNIELKDGGWLNSGWTFANKKACPVKGRLKSFDSK
jgi:hypothetical protein